VTIAALVVLLFAPEAVVHPSFQMSFAATLALVAAYAHGLPLTRPGTDSSLHARAALGGVNEAIGLVLASLVAGLATTPYAAYHFHRIAPYGVLAIPFGFDGIFWRQMGYGIEWMDTVALWVASLPGAFGRVTSFGTAPLLLATVGLLLIRHFKTPLRWSGAAFVVLAIVVSARAPVPDILVAADGRTSRCAAPTASSLSIAMAATLSPCASGWRGMPTAATRPTAAWATASGASVGRWRCAVTAARALSWNRRARREFRHGCKSARGDPAPPRDATPHPDDLQADD
jgi:predicted membrane metal-binding protein